MRKIFRGRWARAGKEQLGFALIEILVATGIIVALAAVIVPLVIQFTGSDVSAAVGG